MQAGTQSQRWEVYVCRWHATILLRSETDPQWKKCYRDKADPCAGENPAMFFKIENKSWQRQSPGTSDEAGQEGKAGHRRCLTNTPSLDWFGQTETGLSLMWSRWKVKHIALWVPHINISALEELLGTIPWGYGTAQKVTGKHPAKRYLKTTNKVMCLYTLQTHFSQGNKNMQGWEDPLKSPQELCTVWYTEYSLRPNNKQQWWWLRDLLCCLDMSEEQRNSKPQMKDWLPRAHSWKNRNMFFISMTYFHLRTTLKSVLSVHTRESTPNPMCASWHTARSRSGM